MTRAGMKTVSGTVGGRFQLRASPTPALLRKLLPHLHSTLQVLQLISPRPLVAALLSAVPSQ
jgi:hypothetical protein